MPFNTWTKFERKVRTWMKFWIKLVILYGQKVTFWTAYLFGPSTHVMTFYITF